MNHLVKRFTLCTLLGISQAYAATYYVSPSGNDLNNGTSLSTPLKTIKKAVSKAVVAGDIIYVRTGTYNETLYIQRDKITLAAYQSEKPVIDGGTTLPSRDWGSLITLAGNYDTVSGFEIKNSNINGTYKGGYGVAMMGHHNIVSKVNVHHAWEQGVILHGDNNTIEDSVVWQTARHNSNNTTGSQAVPWGLGIMAGRNKSAAAIKPGITSYAVIRRNKVFNNWGEGIGCYVTDYCTIEDNTTYDNWTINLYVSNATNTLVQRNLVYVSSAPAIPTRYNSNPGLLLADEETAVPAATNTTLINNIICNADLDAYVWTLVNNSGLKNALIANNTIVNGGLFVGSGGSKNITHANSQIRNNIIYGDDSKISSNQGITFSSNNWAVPVVPTLGKSSTDVIGNPQLAKTGSTAPGALTGNYFKLLTSSPNISKGVPLSKVTVDLFKTPRHVTTPDIGAHELP